jgi:heme/copper-type cytochrome/quinol oxidase subunit 2
MAPFSVRFAFPAYVFNNRVWVIGGAADSFTMAGNDTWYTPASDNPADQASALLGSGVLVWVLLAVVILVMAGFVIIRRKRNTDPDTKTPDKKSSRRKEQKKKT